MVKVALSLANVASKVRTVSGDHGIMMPSRAVALIGVNCPGLTPIKALPADPG
jgi:hypothetical protein